MLHPLADVDKARVGQQLGCVERLAQALEHVLTAGLDDQAAVRRLVHAGRVRNGVVVACLAWDLAFEQVARRLELHQPNIRLQQ